MHAALVSPPGSCIRRLGGTRAQEMRFTRFLRNDAVTAVEMARHAGALTAQRAAGYGAVGKGGELSGLLLHPLLAVEAGTGALLGLVSMDIRNRTDSERTARRKRATPEASRTSQP